MDPSESANSEHPYQASSSPVSGVSARRPPTSTRLVLAVLWAAIVLAVGSTLASVCVLRFGELGLFVVWPVGWVSGLVAVQILGGRSKLIGALLVVTCFGIAAIAELNWIHAKIEGADESWFKTISLLPAFVRQYKVSAFLTLLLATFGAMSAWQAVAVRYVRVRIDE